MRTEVAISKKHYLALESLADGLLWVNEQGHIVHVNENFSRMLGYQDEGINGRKVFDIEFQSHSRSYPLYWKRLQKGEKIKRQTFFLSREEELVPATVQMCMEEGGLVLWLVYFQSYSLQSHELLEWCADWNGVAAWQWDLLRGNTIVTSSFYRIFHLPEPSVTAHRENIIGLLRERLSNEQIIWLTKALGELHHTHQSIEREFWFEWEGQGKNLIFHAEVVSKRDQVVHIRGLFQVAEEKVEVKKELVYHKKVLDKMTNIVCWLAPDCSFRYVNPAAVQQLGYEEEELLGGITIMDIEAERTKKEWEALWERLKKEEVVNEEGSFQRKNGSVFPVELQLAQIRSGKEMLVSLVARNISQPRREEGRLRRALVEIDNLSRKLEAENIYLQKEVSSQYNFENIISRSPKYQTVLDQIRQVAPTEATVLILGETGTGKELLARAIHRRSRRHERPLIKVDCGTIPEHLMESELFGHEKGAFTGAVKEKPGRFELADGGTLFLDEIGELPLELQPKLLRVLQEGEFVRVGSNEVITVDIRFIVATNRNLQRQVKKGNFRSDLYYRINIFPIYNLPLRERPEDVPLLAEHFLKEHNEKIGRQIQQIPPRAREKLIRYDYPGNVRELESIIERAVILSSGDTLSLEHWNPNSETKEQEPVAPEEGEAEAEILPFEEMQRLYILRTLEKTNWRVSGEGGAAELLELNPQTLYSKMKKLGIKR